MCDYFWAEIGRVCRNVVVFVLESLRTWHVCFSGQPSLSSFGTNLLNHVMCHILILYNCIIQLSGVLCTK